ncbi:MAG: 3-phosphoserine/phosphohydroxythreonine transaminase [Bacteroidota bacterium]
MTNHNSILNFNAGPAALPAEVLQQTSQAVINYNNTGLSILEIPHRGKHFDAILEESKSLVIELCGLGNDYEVLFMHGGGRLQFCMIPMNFTGANETAGYIDSGHWAAEAADYAKYYGKTEVLCSSKSDNYSHLPVWPSVIDIKLSYLHYTTNNTIYGTQWKDIPACNVPLIADMSSDIFSQQRDYSRCAMFYAVAQKNIGPAGTTLVVLHKDMLKKINKGQPPMLDYAAHVKENSVLNTPPVFAIYTTMLMLRWIKAKGIAAVEKENAAKAALLYDEVSRNSLFHSIIKESDRSTMNVCFVAKDVSNEKTFITFCEQRGITNIAGHRSTGGFRASLYNAIPLSAVKRLVQAMKEFEIEKA